MARTVERGIAFFHVVLVFVVALKALLELPLGRVGLAGALEFVAPNEHLLALFGRFGLRVVNNHVDIIERELRHMEVIAVATG